MSVHSHPQSRHLPASKCSLTPGDSAGCLYLPMQVSGKWCESEITHACANPEFAPHGFHMGSSAISEHLAIVCAVCNGCLRVHCGGTYLESGGAFHRWACDIPCYDLICILWCLRDNWMASFVRTPVFCSVPCWVVYAFLTDLLEYLEYSGDFASGYTWGRSHPVRKKGVSDTGS